MSARLIRFANGLGYGALALLAVVVVELVVLVGSAWLGIWLPEEGAPFERLVRVCVCLALLGAVAGYWRGQRHTD